MKKTLLSALFLAMSAAPALTAGNIGVIFVDKNGNEVADGSMITRSEVVDLELVPGVVIGKQIDSDLYVKNTSNKAVEILLEADVQNIPFGQFQLCYPVVCWTFPGPSGTYPASQVNATDTKTLDANSEAESLRSEWVLENQSMKYNGESGEFDVVYQLLDADENLGPKVTVHYSVGGAGVDGVAAGNKTRVEVARYDILGQKVSAPVPGINIVKYSDGTTAKLIVKP